MTYIEGFVVPVPAGNRAEYEKHARKFAPLMLEVGIGRMVESWDSEIAQGKVTDFRKAVDAKPDEKIVFSWFEYPSRKQRDAANTKMMSDPRMTDMGTDMPFDGRRMIMGGFESIVDEGGPGGRYIDGMIVPVIAARRDEYRARASAMAKVFREHGATHVVESLADDVGHGEVTDFYRAVKAEDGETIAFSFIEWPDKGTRDAAWGKMIGDESLRPQGEPTFVGQRMFWGGFEAILDTAERARSAAQVSG